MPLSSAEQQIIEDMVAAASPDQRDNMRLDAEAALRQINNLMARRLLSQEETKVAERAIEILVGPSHDWSSHGADAFGLMAISWESPGRLSAFRKPISYPKVGVA